MTGGRIARAAGVTANQWWCWWRDSNPHWADFKSAASADWATPARPGRSEPLDLLVGLLDPPLLLLLVLGLQERPPAGQSPLPLSLASWIRRCFSSSCWSCSALRRFSASSWSASAAFAPPIHLSICSIHVLTCCSSHLKTSAWCIIPIRLG